MKNAYLDCLAIFGVGGAHPGGLKATKEMLAKENIDENTSILDIGCGTGQTAAYLKEQYGSHVRALDSNELMVEKARRRLAFLQLPVDVIKGDAEDLPFSDSLFDIVLSESVAIFTKVLLTFSECKRVLKPDGVLLAIEMVLEKQVSELDRQRITTFYGIDQLLTESDWYESLHKAGFQSIHIEEVTRFTDTLNVQDTPDFSLSEQIDDSYKAILEEHEQISKEFEGILGFRIFRCC